MYESCVLVGLLPLILLLHKILLWILRCLLLWYVAVFPPTILCYAVGCTSEGFGLAAAACNICCCAEGKRSVRTVDVVSSLQSSTQQIVMLPIASVIGLWFVSCLVREWRERAWPARVHLVPQALHGLARGPLFDQYLGSLYTISSVLQFRLSSKSV